MVPKSFISKYKAKGTIGRIPINCCHPATIKPSDLMPPYFTIIVPIPQLNPAAKVIKKPNELSNIFISIERQKIPNMPNIPDDQKPAIGKVIAPAALF